MKSSQPFSINSRLPSLDGWRALSILLVLGAHSLHTANFPGWLRPSFSVVFDANLGVRCFFIISGFLITWLMIVERRRTGRVDLRSFYIRRALRILPVYGAFLLVLCILSLVTPYTQSASSWIGNLTFTTNYLGDGQWVSGHLWSLAVEEQFYVVWPLLFAVVISMQARRWLWWSFVLAVCVPPVSRIGSAILLLEGSGHLNTSASLVHSLSAWINALPPVMKTLLSPSSVFNYTDSLAFGCMGAFALDRYGNQLAAAPARSRIAASIAAIAAVLVPEVLAHVHGMGISVLSIPLGATLQGLGLGVLIIQSVVAPHLAIFRGLNVRWICGIGTLSYSIYIWQQLFCSNPQEFGTRALWLMSFPGWIAVAVAIAAASYYGLEKPFLRLRTRFRGPAHDRPVSRAEAHAQDEDRIEALRGGGRP